MRCSVQKESFATLIDMQMQYVYFQYVNALPKVHLGAWNDQQLTFRLLELGPNQERSSSKIRQRKGQGLIT